MERTWQWLLGNAILVMPFMILLLAALGFMVGLSLNVFWVLLAAGGVGVYLWQGLPACPEAAIWRRRWLTLWGSVLLLTAIGALGTGWFYDISYDGQTYHQEAVKQLGAGWNPVHEYISRDVSIPSILLNHYAKGPWIYAAAFQQLTGWIETAKVFNWLLLLSSWLLAWAACREAGRFSERQAASYSLLAALNPVSLYQSLTFYIDGQLGSLLLCLAAVLYAYLRSGSRQSMFSIIVVVGLLVNVKFTGVVYAVAAFGVTAAWLYGLKRWGEWRRLAKVSIGSLLLGVAVLGYNPYVTNTLYYGHPFYPLYGAGAKNMDIMTSNSPQGFMQMNPLHKMVVATFSASNNQFDSRPPQLKLPLQFSLAELRPFVYGADIRIGGFGPWFSGGVVASLLCAALVWRSGQRQLRAGVLLAGSIMLTVLVNPEAWWARYAPQWWCAVVLTGLVAAADLRPLVRRLGQGLAVICAVNILMVSYPYFIGSFQSTRLLDQSLQALAAEHRQMNVFFDEFTSNIVRFERHGIVCNDVPAIGADLNIHVFRYQYLQAITEYAWLKPIFVAERKELDELNIE